MTVDSNNMEEIDLKDHKKGKLSALFSNNSILSHWKGAKECGKAQVQVLIVLLIAYLGNNFPKAYPRNDNHNLPMFWVMNGAIAVAALLTMKHDSKISARGVQLLSRPQTEEWKGWMQWAFIMYHYYRAYPVYNVIRVFVSAYVWMTGFGNYLYFDKTQDFTITRAVSMWLRINYFPLLLSWALSVPLELYYVVPLHTAGFFITMATCYLAKQLVTCRATAQWFSPDNKRSANMAALGICLLLHVLFYETPAVNVLKVFSNEYLFRFQSDKYSAWFGMLSGFCWGWLKDYMQWCYNNAGENSNAESTATEDSNKKSKQVRAQWIQRIGGVGLIALWWTLFGHLTDKFTYNPIHPYCFWMPVAGWLMVRNSSKYLTELHSTALEFFGRITLETYVLQFHVFMCRDVQYIPILIPGSGPDGNMVCKTLNMLVWGVGFVALSFWARQITVTTQNTITDLVQLLVNGPPSSQLEAEKAVDIEKTPLIVNHGEQIERSKDKAMVRTSSDDTIDTVSTTLSDEV